MTQHNTTQHNTTQHNTTQHNTTQHNTTQTFFLKLKNKILCFNSYLLFCLIFLFLISCKEESNKEKSKIGEIILDPYGTAPLSAIYKLPQTNTNPITVTVKGLYGEQDISHTYPANYGVEFDIHGMFINSTNTIIVKDGDKEVKKDIYISNIVLNNHNLPSKFTVAVNNLSNENVSNPNIFFVGFAEGEFNIGISENGYVRYISKLGYIFKVYTNDNSIKFYSYSQGIYDLIGRKIVDFKNVVHHDGIKIKDNYVVLGSSKWSLEDRVIEVDSNGNIVRDLNAATFIKDIVLSNGNSEEIKKMNRIIFDEDNKYIKDHKEKDWDWAHINSLVYDSDTDILYISSRHYGVMAVNYSEWKLIWWMADSSLNTEKNPSVPWFGVAFEEKFDDLPSLDPYRVKGAGVSDGPKNQHALFLLKNGNLAMFDNQGDENYNNNGSRYVEYNITGNYGNYTAEKVYEYRDKSLYSRITSDVDYTGNNYQNILMYYGTINTIVEIEKESKKELLKIELGNINNEFGFTYRVDKMPFYYEEGRVYSEDSNLKN